MGMTTEVQSIPTLFRAAVPFTLVSARLSALPQERGLCRVCAVERAGGHGHFERDEPLPAVAADALSGQAHDASALALPVLLGCARHPPTWPSGLQGERDRVANLQLPRDRD